MKAVIIFHILLLPGFVHAQTIKKPDIGDQVPAMQVHGVINYRNDTILHLPSQNGKAVLIDFWGQFCSPCIKALGKLDSLYKIFEKDLDIVAVSDFSNQEDMLRTINKYRPAERNISLTLALANPALNAMFPYNQVSHVVWIDRNGIVRGFTGTEYVNKENIEKLINGVALNLPVKRDMLSFDPQKPLLSFTQPDMINPGFYYYSTFTAYLDGISSPNGFSRDSITQSSFIRLSNQGLLGLIGFATGLPASSIKEESIWHVKDKGRYIRRPDKMTQIEWSQKNAYTYYARLPITISEKDAWKFVREDLLKWLDLMDISVKKEINANGEPSSIYTISEKDYYERQKLP